MTDGSSTSSSSSSSTMIALGWKILDLVCECEKAEGYSLSSFVVSVMILIVDVDEIILGACTGLFGTSKLFAALVFVFAVYVMQVFSKGCHSWEGWWPRKELV